MDSETPKAKAKSKPTFWHQSFAYLVQYGAPPDIEVRAEVQFTSLPNQPDLLLLRRSEGHDHDHEALVLRGLWQHIDRAALVEFKSPSRQYRRNGLLRLCHYGGLLPQRRTRARP